MKNLKNLNLEELTIGEQVNIDGGCIIGIFFGCFRVVKIKDGGIDKRENGPRYFW